jgi:glucose/mannose transport system substrate-binding protein
MMGIAGCSSAGGGEGQPLEVMIAWTGEDGAAGFDAMHEGFKQEYPNVETEINDNPGGAGTGLATALDTRMFDGVPPSTWGFFPGPDLTDYAEAGLLGNITATVWEEEGLEDVIPEYIRDLCRFEDAGYTAVPIEFNRLNNIYYNVEIVEEAGVDPADISSPSDLVDAMAQIESETDAFGLAQSSLAPWTIMQLWEVVFLAEYGLGAYSSFLEGSVAGIETEIKDALATVVEFNEYANEDAGSVNFTEATSKFIGKDTAFLHDGQWAVGNFNRAENYDYESDWNAVPFPGSENLFVGQCSAFMYPEPNPTPEATTKWLRYTGSNDAQMRFNSLKGGVPCRNDTPMDDDEFTFSAFQQAQYQEFLDADNLTGIIAHNNVIVPQIASNVSDVFASFAGNWDVDNTYQGLVDAFDV